MIRTEGWPQVKRVAAHPVTGRITIISDNKEYYPAFADLPPEDVAVIGRVLWLGRHLGNQDKRRRAAMSALRSRWRPLSIFHVPT